MMRWQRYLARGTLALLGATSLASFLPDVYQPRPEPAVVVESEPVPSAAYQPTGVIAEDAEALGVLPEDLVFMARVVYFEGAFDKKARGQEGMEEGYQAIASVIKNRRAFDVEHSSNKFGGEAGLVGVVEKKYAFSCIPDNKGYFTDASLTDRDGNLVVATKRMDVDRADQAYDHLVSVLSGLEPDNTEGATFYKTDGVDETWHNTEAFWLSPQVRCLRQYTKKLGSHEFFSVDCR